MSPRGKPKEQGESEQLNKLLAMLKIGREQQPDQATTTNAGSRRQYEAVLKHRSHGLLDREFFDDPNVAKRWLFRRWAGLGVPLSAVDSHYAAAIYDQHDSRKCIFTMGASHILLDE